MQIFILHYYRAIPLIRCLRIYTKNDNNMATVGFYLDTRREKKDGTFPVKLQVRHKGQIMLCTDFCATPETWTGTEYNKNAKNHKAKNVAIRNLINRVEMLLVILDDNQKLKGMSDKALKDYILKSIKNESTCKTFVSYIDEFVATKTKENTIVLYKATKNKILAYDPTCTFETMTRRWLESFNKWLKDTGIKTNSISIHLRNIRAVFNHAIDNEETELYPFRKFTIEREETRKRSLKPDQLITLRDFNGEEYQKEYQDIFMLMFYLIGKAKDRKPNIITSLELKPEAMEINNLRFQAKYREIEENEVRFEEINCEDAEYLIIAFGSMARIGQKAMELAREKGIKVGILRPITLWPFPTKAIAAYADKVKGMLVTELNAGQMIEDVRLAVNGKVKVEHFGRLGGIVPDPDEIVTALKEKIIK